MKNSRKFEDHNVNIQKHTVVSLFHCQNNASIALHSKLLWQQIHISDVCLYMYPQLIYLSSCIAYIDQAPLILASVVFSHKYYKAYLSSHPLKIYTQLLRSNILPIKRHICQKRRRRLSKTLCFLQSNSVQFWYEKLNLTCPSMWMIVDPGSRFLQAI